MTARPWTQFNFRVAIRLVGATEPLCGGEFAEVDGLGRPLSFLGFLDAFPNGRAAPRATLALVPEEAQRRLLRADLGKAIVLAPVPDGGNEVMDPIFDGIEGVIADLRRAHPELAFELTGTDKVARANVNRMIDDLARSIAFAVLVIFGVIALEFRSLRIGLLSLLPNLFPLILVGGVLRLLGQPLQMATAVLFTVLLGLAVDDTIHFLSRYRREQRAGGGAGDPIERALLSVGRAILVTTIVLVVGFGTVGLSEVPTNRVFAALSVLGLVGAWIGDLVFLPALLAWTRRDSSGAVEPSPGR